MTCAPPLTLNTGLSGGLEEQVVKEQDGVKLTQVLNYLFDSSIELLFIF